MVKNFTQATAALALLILILLIPTTDVAHASCSDNSDCEEEDDDVEVVIAIGQRERRAVTPVGGGGGGNEAPAPNNYGQGRGGGSAGRPGPADSSGADVQKVKDCAADKKNNIFKEAESKGTVNVHHSDALMFTPTGEVAYGRADWIGGEVLITVYTWTLAGALGKNSDAYWRQYAITLLHEYRHAVDMFECQCNLESQLRSEGYEPQIERAAQDDYKKLYAKNESCLAR